MLRVLADVRVTARRAAGAVTEPIVATRPIEVGGATEAVRAIGAEPMGAARPSEASGLVGAARPMGAAPPSEASGPVGAARPMGAARVTRAAGRWRFPRRSAHGAVTAETVMVLPVLVAVALGLAWVLALGATQVRVVDAAREVARSAARADSQSQSFALGRRVAPGGATISLRTEGDVVVAQVRAEVRGPGGLFGFLTPVTVTSEAVAAREQQ